MCGTMRIPQSCKEPVEGDHWQFAVYLLKKIKGLKGKMSETALKNQGLGGAVMTEVTRFHLLKQKCDYFYTNFSLND